MRQRERTSREVKDALYEQFARVGKALSSPKRVEIVGSDDHGTDLLTGGKAEQVRRLIETFLAQQAGS